MTLTPADAEHASRAPSPGFPPLPAEAGPHTPAPVSDGPADSRPAPKVRLRALDGLRLVAALMVAGYHYGGRDGDITKAWGNSPSLQFPTAHHWFTYGCLGVQIFFVISGFVICMSGWGRPLTAFFASRVSRLMPAYWTAVILVTAVFALPMVAYEAVSPSDGLLNMTLMQLPLGADRVLGVCWTLWAEIRFYALFALFVVLPGATRRRVVLFCAVWTMAAVMTDAADSRILDVVLMPQYAPFFIGGVGLYLVHRDRRDALGWGIAGVSLLLGQHYAVVDLWRPPSTDAFANRSAPVIILIVTLGFVAVAAIGVGLLNWMNWKWLTVAGALTYPFYLVHEHLGWVAVTVFHRELGIASGLTMALTTVSMLVLAWLIHRLVERPFTPKLRKVLLTQV
ncbi:MULTISPECIES: acyltransferase family protein [unclassified Streptomyces]|uniref:acyltransferase family protein n=1 Tax=unclassified Streptomyces TaxID=2593676 RepID=UPI0038663897